jgi:hypothetical protein
MNKPSVPNKNKPGRSYEHAQALKDNEQFEQDALAQFKEDDELEGQ